MAIAIYMNNNRPRNLHCISCHFFLTSLSVLTVAETLFTLEIDSWIEIVFCSIDSIQFERSVSHAKYYHIINSIKLFTQNKIILKNYVKCSIYKTLFLWLLHVGYMSYPKFKGFALSNFFNDKTNSDCY